MLQGSLENFALDEVLGFLSSAGKTGKLEITGDRGTGNLLFSDGLLVGASATQTPNGDSTEDVMFELLRFKNGNFAFSSEEVASLEDERDLSSVLVAAETRLNEWRDIESVVPSLGHIVTPIPELPSEEVTLNRSEWALLNVVAAGCPVSLVCEELGLGEVEGSKRIKDLAERSLVLIGQPLGSNIISDSMPPSLEPSFDEPIDSLPTSTDFLDDVPPPPIPDDASVLDSFDTAVPPSLSGIEEVGSDSDKSKNGMLKRYLSSDD